MNDTLERIQISLAFLPLKNPVSDAKVATGRQRPLTEVAFLFAELESAQGHKGLGFSYSKRAGGPGLYAHAKEIAPNLLRMMRGVVGTRALRDSSPADIEVVLEPMIVALLGGGRA